MSTRPVYEHRQSSPLMRLLLVVPLLMMLVVVRQQPAAWLPVLVATAVATVVFLCFDGLTILITDRDLQWRFGWFGFPRGSVALADIAEASVTRTRFWEGWGIHITRRGWLYNVAGCDAVLVKRRSTSKTFLLGTDEPPRLLGAIRHAAKLR